MAWLWLAVSLLAPLTTREGEKESVGQVSMHRVVAFQRFLVLQRLQDIRPQAIADQAPQLSERLTVVDVEVGFLRDEISNKLDVDLWLGLADLLDGFDAVLAKVRLKRFQERGAKAIACALRTTLWIAALPRLEGHEVSRFFFVYFCSWWLPLNMLTPSLQDVGGIVT
jgi:hypothetical protein